MRNFEGILKLLEIHMGRDQIIIGYKWNLSSNENVSFLDYLVNLIYRYKYMYYFIDVFLTKKNAVTI